VSVELLPGTEISLGVVETLESLLARARSGELRAIAVSGLTRDGTVPNVMAWGMRTSRYALLGAIEMNAHALRNDITRDP